MGPRNKGGTLGLRDRPMRDRLQALWRRRCCSPAIHLDGPSQSTARPSDFSRMCGMCSRLADPVRADVVRIDQYYTSPDVVDGYHQVRREFFNGRIPPSTSNLHRRFAARRAAHGSPGHGGRSGSEFRRAARAEKALTEFTRAPVTALAERRRFPVLAGSNGRSAERRDAPVIPRPPCPRSVEGHAHVETHFIIRRKLVPTLEAGGAGLDTVVKAQVYLRDQRRYSRLSPGVGPAFSRAAGDDDHRNGNARFHHAGAGSKLTRSLWQKTA